jgi:NADPH-dependent 2,4-dienoyl-CoA reductase/sulfur reductase-like enzyme
MHRGGGDSLRRNAMDQIVDGLSEVSCDVLVIGGGTAGPMAAL